MLSSGHSYKDSTIVNYDPRVVIYERKMFIIDKRHAVYWRPLSTILVGTERKQIYQLYSQNKLTLVLNNMRVFSLALPTIYSCVTSLPIMIFVLRHQFTFCDIMKLLLQSPLPTSIKDLILCHDVFKVPFR